MFEIISATSGLPYMFREIGNIPEVLIDFLKKIVEEDISILRITLIPTRLGHGMVQDIILESAQDITIRRVYGFDPVEARLGIRRSGKYYELFSVAE